MRAAALPRLVGPAIVIAQAGNVNTGASDPFEEIIDLAHGTGAWVHVDGAFGLWAAASAARRRQVAGVERADSWATDAHKWLNVPVDSGLAFVPDAQALRAAMARLGRLPAQPR
jgi:glutamate/tyrosine decarboxylase-like PLP-dependent enzyme